MPTISKLVKESEEKAMTNADKIRNMTVDELCEFICSVSTNCQSCRFKDGGCNLVEWIDGEVEEEEKSMNTQDFDSFSDSIADKIRNMTVDRCAELIRETMSSLAEADYSLSLTDCSKFSLESFLDAGIINTDFYDWLINNGFKTAPASTKYHGNVEGGLYRHSCKVTEELVRLTIKLDLEWQRKSSPYIVGMFHDLCKIDQYEKNEDGYEYNSNTLLTGHGDKSIMLLSQFITLTEEEMLCIRYHMGAYNKDDWTGYDLAIKKYPNVLYTHTADMLASKLSI